MLVINPAECIDCGVCEPECPADAIVLDSSMNPEEMGKWEEINYKYSEIWPNITEKKAPLPEWEEFDGVPNKYEKHFSDKPGE